MKKLFLLFLSLSTASLWSAGALAFPQGTGTVSQEWDDLEVDTNRVYVVYQNNRLENWEIKVKEPNKESCDLTLKPDSITVLSFSRAEEQVVRFWSLRKGAWKEGFPLLLTWPTVVWMTPSFASMSEKLQQEKVMLIEKLVMPVQERKELLIERVCSSKQTEEKPKGWIAGAIDYWFGPSNDDGPF